MSISFIRTADYDDSSFGCTYYYVSSEGSSGSELSFQDIVDYFETNPITSPLTYPSSGDLCENNSSDWTGTDVTISNETVIVKTGSYSIKAEVINDVSSSTITWRPSSNNFMPAISCNKIKFWVRSNTTATIETIKLYSYYSSSRPEYYEADYDVRVTLVANTWTQIEIDVHDYTDIDSRFYWHAISRMDLYISGLAVGDLIYLDEFHLSLDDANPKNLGGKMFYFPLPLRCNNSYVKDTFFNYYSGVHTGTAFYNQYGYITFGSNTAGSIKSCQFYKDAVTGRDAGSFFALYHNSGKYTEFYNLSLNCSVSQGCGIGAITNYGTGYLKVVNSILHNTLDSIQGSGIMILDRVTIGSSRYCLWIGGTSSSLTDLKIIRGSASYNYMWLSDNTTTEIIGLTLSLFNGTARFLYGRKYNGATNTKQYIYDIDLLDDCENTITSRMQVYSLTPLGYGVYQYFGYTVNIKIVNEENNVLEGVNVLITDKDNNIIVNETTTSTGLITDQKLIFVSNSLMGNASSTRTIDWQPFKYFDREDTGGTVHAPFKIIISKDGYITQTINDFYPEQKINWTIILKSINPLLRDIEGENYKRIEDNNPDSRIIHL